MGSGDEGLETEGKWNAETGTLRIPLLTEVGELLPKAGALTQGEKCDTSQKYPLSDFQQMKHHLPASPKNQHNYSRQVARNKHKWDSVLKICQREYDW